MSARVMSAHTIIAGWCRGHCWGRASGGGHRWSCVDAEHELREAKAFITALIPVAIEIGEEDDVDFVVAVVESDVDVDVAEGAAPASVYAKVSVEITVA